MTDPRLGGGPVPGEPISLVDTRCHMSSDVTRRQALVGGLGVAALGLAAGTATADEKKPDPDKKAVAAAGSETELVHTIDKIELEGTGSPPVHYLIKVTGSVLRPNYKSPVLILHSTTPDRNGVLTYYFAADPPVGGAPGKAIPIAAQRYLYDVLKVRTIKVVGATNDLSKNV